MPTVSRYEIHRGRRTEMDRTGSGTAVLEMIDTNGTLDPASGSTDYDPLTPVSISLTNPVTTTSSPIFTGHVARWGYDLYPTERYGTATIECVDGMEILSAAEMKVGQFGDLAQGIYEGNIVYDVDLQVKHRVDHALDDVGWPVGNREVFTGNVKLQRTVYAPRQSALNAITDATDAEFPAVANFYMAKDGKATFHGRLARFNPTDAQYHITTWKVGDLAAFALDSTRAVISALDYDRDKDRIVNSGYCAPEGIADSAIEAQLYEDAASIAAYGTRSWSAENLIIESSWLTGRTGLSECRNVFAKYHVDNASAPRTKVTRLRFRTVHPAHAHAGPTWALMCGVDISDRIQLQTTHHGGAAGFDSYYFVEGIHYAVQPLSDTYLDVTLDLDVSPAAYWTTLPA